MKRILLPFFLFASTVSAHHDLILIRHPQADIDYYCQRGQSLQQCIEVACSYATQYSCRVISQNQNQYFIETYIPANYRTTVVIVPSPVVYESPVIVTPAVVYLPPVVSVFSRSNQTRNQHRVYHRPRRR